jgi:hypothetical protein
MAEFGFFGVVVYTRTQTPRRCGQESKAGDLLLSTNLFLPLRTSCEIVGISIILNNFSFHLWSTAVVGSVLVFAPEKGAQKYNNILYNQQIQIKTIMRICNNYNVTTVWAGKVKEGIEFRETFERIHRSGCD